MSRRIPCLFAGIDIRGRPSISQRPLMPLSCLKYTTWTFLWSFDSISTGSACA